MIKVVEMHTHVNMPTSRVLYFILSPTFVDLFLIMQCLSGGKRKALLSRPIPLGPSGAQRYPQSTRLLLLTFLQCKSRGMYSSSLSSLFSSSNSAVKYPSIANLSPAVISRKLRLSGCSGLDEDELAPDVDGLEYAAADVDG